MRSNVVFENKRILNKYKNNPFFIKKISPNLTTTFNDGSLNSAIFGFDNFFNSFWPFHSHIWVGYCLILAAIIGMIPQQLIWSLTKGEIILIKHDDTFFFIFRTICILINLKTIFLLFKYIFIIFHTGKIWQGTPAWLLFILNLFIGNNVW